MLNGSDIALIIGNLSLLVTAIGGAVIAVRKIEKVQDQKESLQKEVISEVKAAAAQRIEAVQGAADVRANSAHAEGVKQGEANATGIHKAFPPSGVDSNQRVK